MVAATLVVLRPAPSADAAPITNVVISAGRDGTGDYELETWRPAYPFVTDPANFGPSGTVTLDSLTVKPQTETLDEGYMGDVHVMFDGWVFNPDQTTQADRWAQPELDLVDEWVTAGGVLIANEDDPASDALAALFGESVEEPSYFDLNDDGLPDDPNCCDVGDLGVMTPATGASAHPIVNGPFGAWTDIDPGGTSGHFGPVGSIDPVWTVVAQNRNGNAVVITRDWGAGHVILTGDEGFFRDNMTVGHNQTFTLNTFAYAISQTDDANTFGLGVVDPGTVPVLVDEAATIAMQTVGGDGSAITWSASGLPAGLGIDTGTGAITGTPTAVGTSSVTVTATPATGTADSVDFDIFVNTGVVVTDPGTRTNSAGVPITSLVMRTTGGNGSDITWSATGLPAGLSIGPVSGAISGTPTTTGSSSVMVTATPDTGPADSVTFTWNINNDVVISEPGDQSSSVGESVSLDIDVAGGNGSPVTFSATGLPAGLGINSSTGIISGTPTTAQVRSVTVTATDSASSDSTTFQWTITGDSEPAPETCGGLTVTIPGTPGDDELEGTAGPDVVSGMGGNDEIRGMGGNDVICGGPGADRIIGGGGRDTLHGNGGRDNIQGGGGHDIVHGGGEADSIWGNDGGDELSGGKGRDILRGGKKADQLDGNAGGDTLRGNGGPDALDGGSGTDTCTGGSGVDTATGCEA